jgi:parvulin-like peptidyl-prolyl isomerase
MRTALLLLWLPYAAACADLTEPSAQPRPERVAAPEPSASAAATATAPATATVTAPPPSTAAPDSERISASHILVAYQGATRAAPTVTRSKAEAKQRAEKLLARARKGDDFAGLARENSDDPTAKARGGDLGSFSRTMMVKPFADAAFGLKPGEVSSVVVETQFGFHVIKRTQ